MAFILAVVINGFGWLGARWIWFLTTAGLLIGLASMFTQSYRNTDGWGDLIGLLTFMICVIIGFAAGMIIEVIRLFLITRPK
ncbi:hypothetical protein D3C71_2118860 [compost metagenome]